ncbi:MAG: hypothetical protein IIT65_02420 [Lachnospiraceae bacterium]|nr:hypothetical protein [Lachnospiraceae bacterium]
MYYSTIAIIGKKDMDYSSASRLITKIDDLKRGIIDVKMAIKDIPHSLSSIEDAITKLTQQSNTNDELIKMLAYIKPWLLKKKYKIDIVLCSKGLSLTPDGEEKLIEGIKKFISAAKTVPIGMQVNSILIKSISRLLYDSDTDIITIELNVY